MTGFVNTIVNEIERLPDATVFGRVSEIVGLLVEIEGIEGSLSIGVTVAA